MDKPSKSKMIKNKPVKIAKKATEGKIRFFFPEENIVIMADSYEEALKILNK